MRSRSSFRGIITTGCPARCYVYESNLEAAHLKLCLTNRGIAKVEEQPPAISFIDEDGRTRETVLDSRVFFDDGSVVAYAVKPDRRRERFSPGLDKLAAQTPAAFATSIKHISERHLDPISVANAKLILWARRNPVAAHDDAIRTLVEPVLGAVTIASLIERSGLQGNAFRAIVRLIDLGELVPTSHARIAYPMHVGRKGTR